MCGLPFAPRAHSVSLSLSALSACPRVAPIQMSRKLFVKLIQFRIVLERVGMDRSTRCARIHNSNYRIRSTPSSPDPPASFPRFTLSLPYLIRSVGESLSLAWRSTVVFLRSPSILEISLLRLFLDRAAFLEPLVCAISLCDPVCFFPFRRLRNGADTAARDSPRHHL